jgi:hypothetical protein
MKQEGGSMLEVKQHVKWMMKQGNKIKDKTYSETFIKTCKRKNEKRPNPMCYICSRSRIITLAPVKLLHFAEEKRPLHRRCLQQ